MLFNSLAFAVFLPIVFCTYWITKERYRWVVIVLSSYFFYMYSIPQYGLIILGITLLSYVAALFLEHVEKYNKQILFFAILSCLGVLFFFKYFNFFSISISKVLELACGEARVDPIISDIILPVGISFYTFQTMSYVVDVYNGSIKAEHHIGKYAAFVSFFPQLVAGPIERSSNLIPQIKKRHVFNYDQAMCGFRMMIWGYYKKLVIADVLAPFVKKVFDEPRRYSGFSLVLGSCFFAIQIYCDFSGYSDIAIGTAKLFGIDLMKNFKSPYYSGSIKEFWSRWHISLSTWFRDYVYIPLGGNRKGKIRQYINTMITFLISGLWHGANWTFVVWGGYMEWRR